MSIMFAAAFATLSLASCGCNRRSVAQATEGVVPELKSEKVNLLSVEAFADLVTYGDVQLVDVRTPEEYAEGYLKGAMNFDFRSKGFLNMIHRLDKTRTVAVYCRSGNRSAAAAQQLHREGFRVADMQGGIMAWQKAGKPVERTVPKE
ncbi:MAG: rhodanese-like domain-containing protein [Bacteroidales bacterium]|nr:rhodanese-like domain-containing protein [Bacteroidales bacterium]